MAHVQHSDLWCFQVKTAIRAALDYAELHLHYYWSVAFNEANVDQSRQKDKERTELRELINELKVSIAGAGDSDEELIKLSVCLLLFKFYLLIS